MQRSKIPSPARSEGVRMTPRRHRFRSSRSVSSPARSDTSVKLSSIVQMHAMKSPLLSPLRTRRSVLSDNTDIEVPGRKSWWRNLEENSRDVMEVFESKTTEQPDNIEEYIEADFKSQENDYTMDLPESSDGESITSIVLPQRKFFSQKQTQAHELFNKIIENRENLTHRKSKANTDNTIFVGKKNFFNRGTEERRSRPVFPAGLLNMTEDKTLMNKTHDMTKHGQIRNLLGNRAGTKRKNMFAQFIMSESEDEIPDIEPNVFGFSKSKQQQQRKMSASQSTRNTSPRSNETDLEFDDWQHLPSSTMVDNEFGNIEDSSPVKRPRLSKPSSVIEALQENSRNKLNKTKQSMSHGPKNDNTATEKSNMNKDISNDNNNKTLTTQLPNAKTDNLGQSAAEIIQVDSDDDDDNNFTLRYENDDKNMQENDEMDITVKELEKDNSSANENNITTTTNITKKVLNSQNSLKGSELKDINKSNNQPISVETKEAYDVSGIISNDQSKNISWKVVETHQEHHAAINVREDLYEKDANKKTNTSISTINREDPCYEIDNREISIEKSSCDKEKTYIENTSTTTAQEARIVERNQKHVMQEEEKSKNNQEHHKLHKDEDQQQINKTIEKVDYQMQKSAMEESMDIDDDVDSNGKALNEKQKEEGNHIDEVNNRDDTVPRKEKEIDYISGDVENIENECAEKADKENTTSSTHVNNEAKHQENHEKHDNNERNYELYDNKKEAVKGIPISTKEEKNKTNCEENREGAVEEHHEKGNDIRHSTEKDEKSNESNKETEQIPVSFIDENIDREDEENGDDSNEYENIDEDKNNTENSETANKSLDENIETEDERSLEDDHEKQEDDDEEQEDEDEEDNAEESIIPNESNEETDKQTGISSMDVNVETEDEENPDDSDKEDREEDEDDENNEEENEITNKSNDVSDNQGGISFVNGSIETENEESGENNEEEKTAEENEIVNENNEETDNEIGMPFMDENIETGDEDGHQESHKEINESERHNDSNSKHSNAKHDNQVTLSKGRIYLTNITGESTNSLAEEVAEESDHEESRQLALEQCLMKIRNDNIERKRKIEEEVKNSLKAPLRKPLNHFNPPARMRPTRPPQRTDIASGQTKTKAKKITSLLNIDLPPEILDDLKYKPPRRYQPKNASWTTKRLYKYLETKLEPKYDYKARVMAEKLVKAMYEFTKEVRRHRVAPPASVDLLKQQMARTGVVSTHYDFYKFFRDFMPREIRIKVVPDVVNEIPLPRSGVFSDIVWSDM